MRGHRGNDSQPWMHIEIMWELKKKNPNAQVAPGTNYETLQVGEVRHQYLLKLPGDSNVK